MKSNDKFISLVNKVEKRELTSKNVKDLLIDILEKDLTLDEIIKENNISNITDSSMIDEIIDKVIGENHESVNDYHSGHDRAFKYLMGQVMKESHGSIDPLIASQSLKERLEKDI